MIRLRFILLMDFLSFFFLFRELLSISLFFFAFRPFLFVLARRNDVPFR